MSAPAVHGPGQLPEPLLGVQRTPPEHVEAGMAEWCPSCERWHQLAEHPRRCTGGDGDCIRLTDSYHGRCDLHR